MKSKPLHLWNVSARLLLWLCVGGCSGETSELPTTAHVSSVPLVPAPRQQPSLDEAPLAMEELALAEVATALERTTSEAQLPPLEASAPEPEPEPEPAEAQPTTDPAPASALTWDHQEQRQVVSEDEGPVLFSFRMTNSLPEAITIEKINMSCGCTTVDTKSLPFSLEPGASENVQISMSVTGKFGTVTKSVLVQTSCGSSTLLVTSEVTPATDEVFVEGLPNGAAMSSGSRGKNISLAKADRQAVFKGSCAECHAQSAKEQFGYNLYLGACAICHDAKRRASMVPDLRDADVPRDAAHWREHITDGIDDTLMPAFAQKKGGILSDKQIESLVKFLVETPLDLKPPSR